jgi:hypothetical protein
VPDGDSGNWKVFYRPKGVDAPIGSGGDFALP